MQRCNPEYVLALSHSIDRVPCGVLCSKHYHQIVYLHSLQQHRPRARPQGTCMSIPTQSSGTACAGSVCCRFNFPRNYLSGTLVAVSPGDTAAAGSRQTGRGARWFVSRWTHPSNISQPNYSVVHRPPTLQGIPPAMFTIAGSNAINARGADSLQPHDEKNQNGLRLKMAVCPVPARSQAQK